MWGNIEGVRQNPKQSLTVSSVTEKGNLALGEDRKGKKKSLNPFKSGGKKGRKPVFAVDEDKTEK